MSRAEQDGHDGFLSRWSRRKSESRTVEQAEPQGRDADDKSNSDLDETLARATAVNLGEPAPNAAITSPQRPDADYTSEAEPPEPLPDIESLTEESDFKPFMAPHVGTEIRNLALRKLFKAAVFGHRDGLDDYDEDFTTFDPLGDTVTADMRHHAERREALARAEREEHERLAQADNDESTEGDPEGGDANPEVDSAVAANREPDQDQIRHTLQTGDATAEQTPKIATGKLRRRLDQPDNDSPENS